MAEIIIDVHTQKKKMEEEVRRKRRRRMRMWMAKVSRGEKGRVNNRAEAEIVISLEVAGFGYQRLRSVYAQYISTLCIGDKERLYCVAHGGIYSTYLILFVSIANVFICIYIMFNKIIKL